MMTDIIHHIEVHLNGLRNARDDNDSISFRAYFKEMLTEIQDMEFELDVDSIERGVK